MPNCTYESLWAPVWHHYLSCFLKITSTKQITTNYCNYSNKSNRWYIFFHIDKEEFIFCRKITGYIWTQISIIQLSWPIFLAIYIYHFMWHALPPLVQHVPHAHQYVKVVEFAGSHGKSKWPTLPFCNPKGIGTFAVTWQSKTLGCYQSFVSALIGLPPMDGEISLSTGPDSEMSTT